MKSLTKILAAGLMLGGTAVAFAAPAHAQVGVSIGIGGPGFYADYDYNRPCLWYRDRDLPVPRRCYDYFYGIWGPGIYVDGDFIFRDRDHWWRWHDRPEYQHWRNHDFHWHGGAGGHGDHGHGGPGWHGDHGGHGPGPGGHGPGPGGHGPGPGGHGPSGPGDHHHH